MCENLAAYGASLVMNFTSESSRDRVKSFVEKLECSHTIKTLIVQADMISETGPANIVEMAKNQLPPPRGENQQVPN